MNINCEILESQTADAIEKYFGDHKISFLHTLRSYVIDAVVDADKLSIDAIDEIITEVLNRMVIDRWIEIGSSQGKFAVLKTDI